VTGFERLFARAGLADVDVTTPGRLDVDIVSNAAKREPEIMTGQRFLRRITTDAELGAAFQAFLAANRLSSHAWVIGRKPITTGQHNG
jgi:hypothetical protein